MIIIRTTITAEAPPIMIYCVCFNAFNSFSREATLSSEPTTSVSSLCVSSSPAFVPGTIADATK